MNNHNSYHNTKHDRYGDHGRSTGATTTQGNAEARLSSSGDARRIRKKGKGRDRDRGFRQQHQDSFEIKTPKILTKADKVEGNVISILNGNHTSTSDTPISLDTNKDQQTSNKIKPTPGVLIKTNESNSKHGDTFHKINKPNTVNSNDRVSSNTSNTRLLSHLKLKEQQQMTKCVKLIDRYNQWSNLSSEYFLDQTDYLVIGIIGPQGVGKSSIMSSLTNTESLQRRKISIFQQQTAGNRENGSHQTEGIDLYITSDRLILLDTQPILSSSVTNYIINNARNYRLDDTSIDVYVEIQSLKQVSFLYSVCHAVIVVQDWFTDLNLLRFLITAEMLTKPVIPDGNIRESASLSEQSNQLPHVVFVYNKSCEKDYHPDSLDSMLSVTDELFRHSRLRYRGSISQFQFQVVNISGINKRLTDINLFLLPAYDDDQKESDTFDNVTPADINTSMAKSYVGRPSYQALFQSLENQILAIPRDSFPNTLSERGWLNHAMRCWEQIEQSSFITEYKRLLYS